jgi:hypothetical protein
MDGQEHTCNHRHLVGTAASVVTAAAAAATTPPGAPPAVVAVSTQLTERVLSSLTTVIAPAVLDVDRATSSPVV